jgi:hypothetical protein
MVLLMINILLLVKMIYMDSDTNIFKEEYLMKKLIVITLSLAMVIAFASATMASTLGVNVSKGNTLCIERSEIYGEQTSITGNFGVSDNLLLSAAYITLSDNFSLGARYEIIENLAVAAKYISEADGADYDTWNIDFRGKLPLNKKLSLAGKAGYSDTGDSTVNLYAAAEYAVTDNFIPTLAVDYYDYDIDGADSDTYIVLGMDIYPLKNFFIYLDYNIHTEASENNAVYIGLEYAF